jgi:hypothetical protein
VEGPAGSFVISRDVMKLDEISARMLAGAAGIYARAAYENQQMPVTVKGRVEFLSEQADTGLDEVLSHPSVERVLSEESADVVEVFALRLGNEKYPHMKLVLRRQGDEGYGFAVECHDQHFEVESTDPDAPRAHDLKRYNQALKETIESAWRDAGLPVFEKT